MTTKVVVRRLIEKKYAHVVYFLIQYTYIAYPSGLKLNIIIIISVVTPDTYKHQSVTADE